MLKRVILVLVVLALLVAMAGMTPAGATIKQSTTTDDVGYVNN